MKITKARWIQLFIGLFCVDLSVNLRNFNPLCILNVPHQKLWRWRNEGKVPAGYWYRDQQIFFIFIEPL